MAKWTTHGCTRASPIAIKQSVRLICICVFFALACSMTTTGSKLLNNERSEWSAMPYRQQQVAYANQICIFLSLLASLHIAIYFAYTCVHIAHIGHIKRCIIACRWWLHNCLTLIQPCGSSDVLATVLEMDEDREAYEMDTFGQGKHYGPVHDKSTAPLLPHTFSGLEAEMEEPDPNRWVLSDIFRQKCEEVQVRLLMTVSFLSTRFALRQVW